jgi:multicomponent Na+:H+ antiporter subunit B
MLIYIAQDTEAFRRIVSHPLLEFAEATGAAGYAVVGLVSLAIGAPFLTNILPLGQTGDVFSSGSIAVISALVGLEVAAPFLLTTFEYLREILSADKDSED